MLSRFISKPSNLRFLTQISSQTTFSTSKPYPPISNPTFNFFSKTSRHFSTNHNNGKNQPQSKSDLWNISSENDENVDAVFGEDTGSLEGITDGDSGISAVGSKLEVESWLRESEGKGDDGDDIFKGVGDKEIGVRDDDWATAAGYKSWNFVIEEKEEHVFDVGGGGVEGGGGGGGWEMGGLGGDEKVESEKNKEDQQLEREKEALSAVLEGPNRAFGDLIAASGITDAMLDSLIALKDLEGIQGLPTLREIEDIRYQKNNSKSTRADIERQKQEEVAKARVRQVDEKGRAYGTGRRKCSIARVWIQPGDGKFIVNDKQFDVYFPMLDNRAALLRPFSETKTLGLWDISCTVKGGGVSGQVGAVRLGISRALQNWEPDLRPPLRKAGFLTRDSRVVERKKPGKAKARKSFQWVKR